MKYVVYGLGVSGISTIKFLAKNGEDVVATDDNEDSLKENSAKFPQIKFLKSNEIKFDAETIISFALGIPLYFPKPHKILEIVKKTGAILACDIEIFYRINRDANFIAITGTNGKSTTTALTGYIFETSSYQLDLLSQTHFGIVALLNITPDHLDRHGSMHGYIEAKKRIFRNQIEGDFALIDVDDENSKKIFDELKNDKNFRATLVPISTKKIQENGVSLFDEKLVNKIGKKNSEFELRSEFLHREHNDQNMAFAFAITHCFLSKHTETSSAQAARSTKHEQIINAITKFRGLHHRMQIVGKIAEIKFINDSKATNAESTKNALKAYENIFWILGGKAKEGGISMLQPYFKKIEKAYLMGEATEDFAQILEKNSVKFEKCRDLKTAFEKAFLDAKKSSLTEKNILLSPACASLDQWKNFEQRGDYFCKLFDELPKS